MKWMSALQLCEKRESPSFASSACLTFQKLCPKNILESSPSWCHNTSVGWVATPPDSCWLRPLVLVPFPTYRSSTKASDQAGKLNLVADCKQRAKYAATFFFFCIVMWCSSTWDADRKKCWFNISYPLMKLHRDSLSAYVCSVSNLWRVNSSQRSRRSRSSPTQRSRSRTYDTFCSRDTPELRGTHVSGFGMKDEERVWGWAVNICVRDRWF